MKKSKFFQLKVWDVVKSAVLAGLMLILPSVLSILESQKFPTNQELLVYLKWAGTAALAYLLKNLFSNSNDQLLTKEKDQPSK